MGATVQRLAEGLDAGTPIVEQTFAIRYDDTLGTLRSRVLGGSVPMLAEAVARLESGKPLVSLPSLGRVYSLPNLRQWLLLHARVAVRRLRASMGAPGW
jgi:methionyl-tRNA formyltransferase